MYAWKWRGYWALKNWNIWSYKERRKRRYPDGWTVHSKKWGTLWYKNIKLDQRWIWKEARIGFAVMRPFIFMCVMWVWGTDPFPLCQENALSEGMRQALNCERIRRLSNFVQTGAHLGGWPAGLTGLPGRLGWPARLRCCCGHGALSTMEWDAIRQTGNKYPLQMPKWMNFNCNAVNVKPMRKVAVSFSCFFFLFVCFLFLFFFCPQRLDDYIKKKQEMLYLFRTSSNIWRGLLLVSNIERFDISPPAFF